MVLLNCRLPSFVASIGWWFCNNHHGMQKSNFLQSNGTSLFVAVASLLFTYCKDSYFSLNLQIKCRQITPPVLFILFLPFCPVLSMRISSSKWLCQTVITVILKISAATKTVAALIDNDLRFIPSSLLSKSGLG